MKRKLADVLWEAANRYLSADDKEESETARWYSCEASCLACGFDFINDESASVWEDFVYSKCGQFFRELGCNPTESGYVFYQPPEQRQGVRYMWLLLAMHVAEEEGIEIEVSA